METEKLNSLKYIRLRFFFNNVYSEKKREWRRTWTKYLISVTGHQHTLIIGNSLLGN